MDRRHGARAHRPGIYPGPTQFFWAPQDQRVHAPSRNRGAGTVAPRCWQASAWPRPVEPVRLLRAAHARRRGDSAEFRNAYSRSHHTDPRAAWREMVAVRSARAHALDRIARSHHLVTPAGMGPRLVRSLDVLPDVQRDRVSEAAPPVVADPGNSGYAVSSDPRAALSSRAGALFGVRAFAAALGATDAGQLRADTSRAPGAWNPDRRDA